MLSEPSWQAHAAGSLRTKRAFAQYLVNDFQRCRNVWLSGGTLSDRQSQDGSALTNYIDRSGGGRTRTFEIAEREESGFTSFSILGAKHNAMYIAALPELAKTGEFDIVCLVRNPLDTISSWRNTGFPISYGRLPQAEQIWWKLKLMQLTTRETIQRQIKIYRLFIHQFLIAGKGVHILHYEDLVSFPSILEEIIGAKIDQDMIKTAPSNKHGNPKNLSSEHINLIETTCIPEYNKLLSEHPRLI